MPYTLYYSPGACSISPHIALREAAQQFTIERVDLKTKQLAAGGDYLAINPNGYVPALRLPNGQILCEAAVMMQYIADHAPDAQLAPLFGAPTDGGGMPRYRMMELLNFIATELHKGMSPFYSPVATDDFKAALAQRFAKRWARIGELLGAREFLFGEHFTIADGYAFYTMRAWQKAAKRELPAELVPYYRRLVARPSVAAALEAEGITA
jgi:glutathione S-transferase